MTNNELSRIYKSKRKIINGSIVEEESLDVKGKNLEECEKIFNKKWGKDNQ